MSMFPNPNLSTIKHCTKDNIFFLHLRGSMNLEEYKNYFLQILEESKRNNCRYWIYDLSEFEYDSLQARTWQVSVFIPKCFRELNKELIIGIIPPPDIMHRMGLETAIKATQQMNYPYQLSYFTNIEKATSWIMSKQIE